MTRRKWTNEPQEDWLKERLGAFTEAQATKKTTTEFYPLVMKEWRKEWPTPDPTPEEITKAGSVDLATKKKRTDEENRLKAWFHNHTRGTTSGSGTRGVLKMKGKPKVLQEWQIYQQMTYEKCWKGVIDKAWETYKTTWEASNPDTKIPQTRFTFMNSFMKQKYQEETAEVHEEVQKRREEMKVEGSHEVDAQANEKNAAYQSAIDKLPRTLAVMGESIRNQTGWNITFLVGGPEPLKNGKIITYMLHCGKSPEGQDFEAYLGDEQYDEHIIVPFDDFLHEAFPPSVRESRSLGSKAGTPEQLDAENEENSGEERNDESETTVPGVEQEPISGSSEYQRSREANIEKNKELFRELGLKDAWKDIKPESEKKERTKKKKNEQEKGKEPTRSSARINPSSISETPISESDSENPLGPNGEAVLMEKSAIATDQTLSLAAAVEGKLIDGALLPTSNAPPSLPTSPLLKPTSAANDISAVLDGAASTADSALVDPPTAGDSVSKAATRDSASKLVEPEHTLSTPPMANPTSVHDPADPASMDVDTGSQHTEPPSHSGSIDVDVAPSLSMPLSRNVDDTIVPPAWLTAINMDVYLREISESQAWQDLITSLFKFEKLNTITGNLPTTSRPNEVASWIKSRKKTSPPDVTADAYGSSFMAWWIAIQPAWRLADDASFNYVAPADEDWRLLHKGGSSGLYTVVVALSWWVRLLTEESSAFRVWTAVRDVQWVIDQIYKKIAPPKKKRAHEDTAQSSKSKKPRR